MNIPIGMIASNDDGKLYAYSMRGLKLPNSEVIKITKHKVSDQDYKIANYEFEDALRDDMERPRKQSQARPRYIYAVIVGDRIKLGRTINLKSRFIEYQRSSSVFRIISTAHALLPIRAEKDMLTYFSNYPKLGEWFDYSPSLEMDVTEYFAHAEAKRLKHKVGK